MQPIIIKVERFHLDGFNEPAQMGEPIASKRNTNVWRMVEIIPNENVGEKINSK